MVIELRRRHVKGEGRWRVELWLRGACKCFGLWGGELGWDRGMIGGGR